MGFSYFNPNPEGKQVGDCTVRAISKATGKSWDETYVGLCLHEFARDHPRGVYVLALSSHVVCVEDGKYFDSWDSGNEIPLFYWEKEDK